MDKNEQQDIIRTIKVMYNGANYSGILATARDMHLDRIKDKRALEIIAEAYERSGLYEDAREALMIAYEKFPQSRSLAYKLAVISVKLENLDDAVDFYEDFCRLSPSDNSRFLLKYMIGKAGGIEAKELIKVLEQYTSREMDDKWLYELARLYHEEGRADECVALCDEITLWYAYGEYEKAALELKFTHKALSPQQQTRYEEIMSEYVAEEPKEPEEEEEPEEEKELEQEAESFVNEFLGGEPSAEYILEHTAELAKQQLEEAAKAAKEAAGIMPAPQEAETETAGESGSEETAEDEPDSDESAIPIGKIAAVMDAEESERLEATKVIYKRKSVPAAARAQGKDYIRQTPAKEAQMSVVALSDEAAAKIGVSAVTLSSKASLVARPSLIKEQRRQEPKEEPAPEPVKEEPAPEIPEPEEPRVGISLSLMEREWDEDDTIEGQVTIDDFFKEYAGLVREKKDEVAAVEAERLRQIVESVSKMEARPLFDLSFDTPENEEFSEEEIVAQEEQRGGENGETARSSGTEAEEEKPADSPAEEKPASETAGKEDAVSEEKAEPEAQRQAPSRDAVQEDASESGAAAGSVQEAEDEEEQKPAAPVNAQDIKAALSEAFAEVYEGEKENPADDFTGELAEGLFDEIAKETLKEEVPEEKTEAAADAKSAQAGSAAPSGGIGEAKKEELDADVAAAIAKFEESMKNSSIENGAEDALMGFGDNLADLVSGPHADVTEIIRMKKFHLSDVSKEEVKEFLLIPGMLEEIERACETIIEKKRMGDPTGGNLIITGDKKSGKTYLAVAIIKAVIRELGMESGKVVKVQSQPLNGKNIKAVFDKVAGRDLIIENVGYLEDETIEDLIYEMEYGDVRQLVVLEGNVLSVENILTHFPEIRRLFASRVNIEELSIAEWAEIAKKYAKEQGYFIDEMATLALHAKIDKINVATSRVGLGDIKDIVDEAISKASRRGSGKLFAAFSKKEKEEIELTENDFL